jgi:hypothetical protein
LRYGVFDSASNKRVMTLSFDLDNSKIVGNSAPDAPDVQSSLAQALREFRPQDGIDPDAQLICLLESAMAGFGLTVKPIPAGDITVNAIWDADSGNVVGRSHVQDGVEAFAPSLLRRINDSVHSAMRMSADRLAAKITALAGSADAAAQAAAALAVAQAEGLFAFEPSRALGDALAGVDTAALEPDAAREFLMARTAIAVRLGDFERAAVDARALLDSWTDLPLADAAECRNIEGIAHASAGRIEAAAAIWFSLAYRTAGIAPSSRAQVLRNLASISPPADPQTLRLFEESSDAFLQAGDRREAAISLIYLGDALEHHSGDQAITMLAKADPLLDDPSLIGEALQAALHYVRAKRLMALERTREAFDAAVASVEARRGLIGQEEELLASLALTFTLAERLGDHRADAFRQESEALLQAVPNPRFVMGARIDALMDAWDDSAAEQLRQASQASGDVVSRIAADTLLIAKDPALTSEHRLARLEALHESIAAEGAAGPLLTPIRLALAGELRDSGRSDRAIPWLQKILFDAPLAEGIARMLLELLRDQKRWGEALSVAKREVSLKGETFDRMIVVAELALSTGTKDVAFQAAHRAQGLAGDDAERDRAQDHIGKALAQGASFAPDQQGPVVAPLTTRELNAELQRYAMRTSADYRMEYWVMPPDGKDYVWAPKPERRAQLQLRTWLDAAFGERVTIIEEIPAGAGRLDLLLQLAGGTQVIVELKMCGFGYSSNYAAAGEEQIRHYMQNRGVHLGFLVVHDGRLKKFGESVLQPGGTGRETVRELFVDIRPRWDKRAGEGRE